MGLTISHNAFAASYGTFRDYRIYLAKLTDINLKTMMGFGAKQAEAISWDTVDDDLKILLDHSDCDGEISVKDCILLKRRLVQLLLVMHDHFWFEITCEFLYGLNQAISKNEKLIFG